MMGMKYLQKNLIVLNHEKNQMRIQPPSNGEDYYLIQETSKSLVNRFEQGSKIVKMCLIVFGSIGVVIGAYAGWKYYKKWSIHRSAQRTRETLRDIIRDRDETSTQNGVFSRYFFSLFNKILNMFEYI